VLDWRHRTIQCHPPDSLVHGPSNSLLSGFLAYVGNNSSDGPREVPDSPMSQQSTASGHVVLGPTIKWRTKQSNAPHRVVRCPQNRKAANQGIFCPSPARTLFTVWCAPDSPVHPRTEGNQSPLNGAPMAPRSLRAIKGTLGAWISTPRTH
jgi:hypothetical protein